ncbi:TRAP transporter substrate-binding protein [Microbacterium pseudoresistens]|uniref:TRAP-type C4-dicarboxylate transport system substrate-binding protein n=1 Tax=Microbacterium pseudoresistens TaxID=640634 RepID=A0A7Y9JMR1_9MICO|nr:TRAP transporter substrate-binding protein DctP [Microbacterium pseudoresistens]NYD54610.1 TRAP-type C4-dicarboxylate transport system substrate-binding protein [Microbacterium pseudoresistens]
MKRTSITPLRRIAVVTGLVTAMFGLSACADSAGGDADGEITSITLRLADGYAASHYYSVAGAQFFIDKVAELTDGAVTIEYYPGGQLGKPTDMIDVLDEGVADIAFTAPGYLPSQMPLSGAFSLPRVLPDGDVGTLAYAEVIGDSGSVVYQRDYADNGLVPLFAGIAADYQVMSATSGLETPEALHGLSARSAGGTIDLIVKALGAEPVPITTGDIYGALEGGMVDANFQGPPGAVGGSLHEVVKAITTNGNFTAFVSAWTMKQDAFDALPVDVQSALREAGAATSQNLAAVANGETAKAMAAFEEAGVTLVTYSDAQLEELDSELSVVTEQWLAGLDAGLAGEDAVAEMKDAVAAAAES